MSITRRQALAAAVGCGLTTAAVRADDKPPAATERPRPDPVLNHGNVPKEVRAACEETFPGHRCLRVAEREEKGAKVFRVTVFDPADMGSESRLVNGERITQLPLYHLELTADGKVLEETAHWIDPQRWPKPVQASYQKWNPKGVEGQEVHWLTEVPRGEARVYRVRIIVNAIKAYSASFREDGAVLAADPAVVP
jgi:hypothetical protein